MGATGKSLNGCVWVVMALVVLSGCTGVPEGVSPVDEFEIERYVGKWYEIARLENSFEKGLEQITAEYAVRDDGGVSVLNRGFSPADQEWKDAEGRAYFVGDETRGHLKVSFFGPFYASYVIFELDKEGYEYAFVSGADRSYLWLLARRPNPPDEVIEKFVRISGQLGFDTDNLVYVNHGTVPGARSR